MSYSKNIILLSFLTAFFLHAQASDYSKNVIRNANGEVYIQGIDPMKQVGPTCNFTTASMILDYFGIDKSAQNIQKNGFNEILIKSQLCRTKWKKNTLQEFIDSLRKSINYGIPIWWGVDMKFAPESDFSSKQKKKAFRRKKNTSLHARLITGYIENNGKIHSIIYSDSWGAKHLNKKMTIQSAFKMTQNDGMRIIYPKDLDPQIIDSIIPKTAIIESIAKKDEVQKSQDTTSTEKKPVRRYQGTPPSWARDRD